MCCPHLLHQPGRRCRSLASPFRTLTFYYLPLSATAATCGRIVLAKLSRALVRQKLLTDRSRRNVDAIKIGIENQRAMTVGTFLGYSLSPLPSNYLFIAYGLTSLP